MVQLFADKLTHSRMGEPTKQRFLDEFYAILRAFYEEFKSVKLIAGCREKEKVAKADNYEAKKSQLCISVRSSSSVRDDADALHPALLTRRRNSATSFWSVGTVSCFVGCKGTAPRSISQGIARTMTTGLKLGARIV